MFDQIETIMHLRVYVAFNECDLANELRIIAHEIQCSDASSKINYVI